LKEDPFLDAHDPQLLKMENELLTHEVRYLRSRVAGEPLPVADSGVAPERIAELESAENELIWLLARLSSGPVGWIARRRSGLRSLMDRYL
jgi:hypothetical protein